MENKVEVFEHEVFGDLEVFFVDNNPMFYGKQVAELLGYSNPNKAVRDHVDDEDKVGTKRSTLGGSQDIIVHLEDGDVRVTSDTEGLLAYNILYWCTIDNDGSYVT